MKATDLGKASAVGGFNLFWGLATSTVISSIGVIVLARLLSPAEYGVVTIALTAPNLIALFRDWGVNTALIRYTAQSRVENRTTEVKNGIVAGLVFEMGSGLFLSILLFLLSDFLGTTIFNRPEITFLIQVASLVVFADALIIASQALFTGYERMELSSITMVLHSILKTVLAPALVIFGLGTSGAIVGGTIARLSTGSLAILLVYTAIYRHLSSTNIDRTNILETMKKMLRYGLPLSIAVILSGFLTHISSVLLAVNCPDAAIGNYTVAINFSVLITFFSSPISTVLFPTFSKINLKEEHDTFRNVFQASVKYAALLVVPVATAIITLAQPAVTTLFGAKYADAPLYLALLAVQYLYTAVGNLSVGNLINSQGRTTVNMKLSLLTVGLGLPLSLVLIPSFGVIGLIITTLTTGVPSLIIALWYVKHQYETTIDWRASTKILLAAACSGLTTSLLLSLLVLASWIELLIGATAFLIAYLIIAPLFGAIRKLDVQNIREIVKVLGPFSTLITLPLKVLENLAS